MKSTARPHSLFALAGFSIAVAGAALVGSRVSPARGEADRWYRELEKPGFTPPGAVFPVVWPVLYALMQHVWETPPPEAPPKKATGAGGRPAANPGEESKP